MVFSNTYYNPPYEWQYETVKRKYCEAVSFAKAEPTISFAYLENYDSAAVKTRELLRFVSDALKKNDAGAIEICIEFVISSAYFHYSGYIRETMARRLKHCTLNNTTEKKSTKRHRSVKI